MDSKDVDHGLGGPIVQPKDLLQLLAKSKQPDEFITTFQKQRGLHVECLEPGLQLLDLLKVKRGDVFRSILSKLITDLGDRLPYLPSDTLTILAEKSLPFLSVPELQQIVIKILSAHKAPPSRLLRIISTLDPDVAALLPDRIRRRMWECNLGVFLDTVNPLLSTYLEEQSATSYCDAMYPPSNSRLKDLRKRNTLLQEIVNKIGTSFVLYQHVVLLVRERYEKSNDERLCSFRNELLMALHGASAEKIWKREPCHHFAWYMDAYVNHINKMIWEGDEMAIRMKNEPPSTKAKNALAAYNDSRLLPELSRKIAGVVAEYRKVLQGKVLQKKTETGVSTMNAAETLKHEIALIIEKVKKSDEHSLFHLPVLQSHPDLVNPDGHRYDKIIETPMDTSTITTKAQQGKYKSIDELRVDLTLIFMNSSQFWGAKHNITKAAKKIFTSKAVTSMLDSAAVAVREAQRIEDIAKAKESKLEQRRKIMGGMEFSERALSLMATSDSKMILASNGARNALLHGLWIALRAESFDKEILPRDAETVLRIAYLLEQGEEAHSCVVASRQGEYTPRSGLSRQIERELLPVLALFTHEETPMEEAEQEEVTQACMESMVGKRALMIKLVRLIHQRKFPSMIQTILDVFQSARLPSDLKHLGFYASVATALESKLHVLACEAKDGSWNQLTVRILDEVLLRAIEEESALKGEGQGPLCRSSVELHAVFAQAVLKQLDFGSVPGARLFAMTSKALAQLVCDTDYFAGSEEYTTHMQKCYLGASFFRARQRYEKLFESDFSWRSSCHVPSKDEVRRLQVEPSLKTVAEPYVSPTNYSPNHSPESTNMEQYSPSETSPAPSTESPTGKRVREKQSGDDDSAASGGDDSLSDDSDVEALFRPSPKRVCEE